MPEQSRRISPLKSRPAPLAHLLLLTVSLAGASVGRVMGQSATDLKGSRDHPMISRVEGAKIVGFSQKEFDEYRLVKGAVPGYNENGDLHTSDERETALNDTNSIRLEGRVWRLTYEVPTTRSTLEIVRSYQTALTKAGFKVLFQCMNLECGGPLPKTPPKWISNAVPRVHADLLGDLLMNRGGFISPVDPSDNQRYLAAHLSRPEGDVYVSVLALGITKAPIARVDVIEIKPLASGLVTVNAAAMAADLATRGSVALYGIYFDTDKADVKPESRPTLAEIATLLKQNAKLSLIVVGHTDNNGTLEHNMDLSLKRSQAVVAALASEFGIERARLDARGVAFLAPVEPNDTEEGRTKNRRVQLVRR